MHRKLIIMATIGFSVLMLISASTSVLAWGPTDRPTYTNESPASSATFNSITDNAGVGDERDFVRIVDAETGGTYSSKIDLEPNKEYQVYIYYHNNASETYNDAAHNYVGVATDVKLASSFPLELSAGQEGAVSGIISWTTLSDRNNVQRVWDEAWVTAKQDLTLHYVEGSAKIYNHWHQDGLLLSAERLFSKEGTFLGTQDLNGIIYGCDEYSGHVNFTISAKAVNTASTSNTHLIWIFLTALLLIIVVGIVWRITHKTGTKAIHDIKRDSNHKSDL